MVLWISVGFEFYLQSIHILYQGGSLILKETMKEGDVIAGCTGNDRDGGEPREL